MRASGAQLHAARHLSPASLCTHRYSVWLCACSFEALVMGARKPCAVEVRC